MLKTITTPLFVLVCYVTRVLVVNLIETDLQAQWITWKQLIKFPSMKKKTIWDFEFLLISFFPNVKEITPLLSPLEWEGLDQHVLFFFSPIFFPYRIAALCQLGWRQFYFILSYFYSFCLVARAKVTLTRMGPAVWNGGFSTFLAFVLLINTDSHIFTTFFKVNFKFKNIIICWL